MRHPLSPWAGLAAAVLLADITAGGGQMGGGMGGQGMGGRPSQMNQPGEQIQSVPRTDKPDALAEKIYQAGVKSVNKARDFTAVAAANAQNPDKKAKALDKAGDNYNRALDQFTEVLRNKSDMYEAWNYVGFVHLQLGAYAEAVDDYNHTLQLKPELLEAIEGRGEAYLGVDRLDDAKSSYMNLYTHDPKLAGQLMASMQAWLTAHRAEPHGMRVSDVDAFGKWIEERDGIAKQAATLPN